LAEGLVRGVVTKLGSAGHRHGDGVENSIVVSDSNLAWRVIGMLQEKGVRYAWNFAGAEEITPVTAALPVTVVGADKIGIAKP
jgi:hypothetical protein